MRIGLDARLAGPGLGVASLIQALAVGLPEVGIEVVWFGESGGAPSTVSEAITPPGPGFAGLDSPRGRRMAAGIELDLMHFAANSGWWGRGPVPHVLTVHDLIWSTSRIRGRSARQLVGHRYLRFAVPRALRSAAAVAVPSVTTAHAVLHRYGAHAEVINNGIAEAWRRPPSGQAADRYLVAFAGRDSRKGTDIAVDAWLRLAPRGIGLRLLAGAGVPRAVDRRLPALRQHGTVEVVPYRPLSELTALVGGAIALLYPSSDEGFGLPVAEAMAAGVPVLTGLTPVTLEIGGDAVMRLDPTDPVGAAARHVERLLADPGLREAVAARGRRQAARFTWAAALAGYRRLYEEVLSR